MLLNDYDKWCDGVIDIISLLLLRPDKFLPLPLTHHQNLSFGYIVSSRRSLQVIGDSKEASLHLLLLIPIQTFLPLLIYSYANKSRQYLQLQYFDFFNFFRCPNKWNIHVFFKTSDPGGAWHKTPFPRELALLDTRHESRHNEEHEVTHSENVVFPFQPGLMTTLENCGCIVMWQICQAR